jgi:hypothetical protein
MNYALIGLSKTMPWSALPAASFRKELNKLSPQRQTKHWRDNPRWEKLSTKGTASAVAQQFARLTASATEVRFSKPTG